MLEDIADYLSQRYEMFRKGTTFAGAKVEDIEKHYRAGNPLEKKRASMYALQLAVDAFLENEITREEYLEVEETAIKHVENFYFDKDHETSISLPDTQKETSQFLLHENEDMLQNFLQYDLTELEYKPDQVVAVSSGGLEPGIIASCHLDAPLSVVSMLRWRKGDEEVHNVKGDYEDKDLLVVEDKAGETLETVEEYLESKRASEIRSASVFSNGIF